MSRRLAAAVLLCVAGAAAAEGRALESSVSLVDGLPKKLIHNLQANLPRVGPPMRRDKTLFALAVLGSLAGCYSPAQV